jgi:hypothetical protein
MSDVEDTAGEAPAAGDAPPPSGPHTTKAAADPLAELRGTWGFPAFAHDFPHDTELATLVASFATGDYATVRSRAPQLAASTEDPAVERAALLLRARIEPDPSARIFFGLTAALLAFLFVYWTSHDGPQHSAPAKPPPPPTVEIIK